MRLMLTMNRLLLVAVAVSAATASSHSTQELLSIGSSSTLADIKASRRLQQQYYHVLHSPQQPAIYAGGRPVWTTKGTATQAAGSMTSSPAAKSPSSSAAAPKPASGAASSSSSQIGSQLPPPVAAPFPAKGTPGPPSSSAGTAAKSPTQSVNKSQPSSPPPTPPRKTPSPSSPPPAPAPASASKAPAPSSSSSSSNNAQQQSTPVAAAAAEPPRPPPLPVTKGQQQATTTVTPTPPPTPTPKPKPQPITVCAIGLLPSIYTASSTRMCVLSSATATEGYVWNAIGQQLSYSQALKCTVTTCPEGVRPQIPGASPGGITAERLAGQQQQQGGAVQLVGGTGAEDARTVIALMPRRRLHTMAKAGAAAAVDSGAEEDVSLPRRSLLHAEQDVFMFMHFAASCFSVCE